MDQSHSAIDVAVNEAVESTTPAYQKLIDLEAFNKGFVQGLIIHLVQTKRSEECFPMSYHRAALNLSSMIALNNVKHFQAAAMLARSVFELAVEIRLIDLMPDAVLRMVAFQRLEKLKAAQKAIRFAANHTLQFATDLTPYNEFIKVHQTSIEAIATSLWGTLKVRHWSNRHLSEQVSSPYSRLDDDRSSTNPRTQAGARTFAVHLHGATWVAVYGWSLGNNSAV
jgi:hypothetical protein